MAEKRNAFSFEPVGTLAGNHGADTEDLLAEGRKLESLSLGNVAATTPQVHLPKKYRDPKFDEKSTFQGAGMVPVTRLANGEVRMLLWQPQSGNKKSVRWYDFGGRKENQAEYTSACACRKFAKQTYGVFGCNLDIQGDADTHLRELYQGLANLPLMLRSSQEWAKLQLLEDEPRIFFNDIHEYHTYLLCVPYVPAEILNKISEIVDDGKRIFKWLSREDIREEVLAPRLYIESFSQQIDALPDDPWVRQGEQYGDGQYGTATAAFSAKVVAGGS